MDVTDFQSCKEADDSAFDRTPRDRSSIRHRQTKKRQCSRSTYFWILDVFLGLTCTYLLILMRSRTNLGLQGDLTGYVPRFSNEIKTFASGPNFISNHTSEASLADAREHWKTLVPRESLSRESVLTMYWRELIPLKQDKDLSRSARKMRRSTTSQGSYPCRRTVN